MNQSNDGPTANLHFRKESSQKQITQSPTNFHPIQSNPTAKSSITLTIYISTIYYLNFPTMTDSLNTHSPLSSFHPSSFIQTSVRGKGSLYTLTHSLPLPPSPSVEIYIHYPFPFADRQCLPRSIIHSFIPSFLPSFHPSFISL